MRRLMFVCLLICSLPSLALDRSRVEGYLLPNGLQVILKSGYERDHVAIRLVVGVGLDDFDCEQKELPHLLEHLLFSGIDDSGEGGLEERLQALGGEWNAYTSSADTTFVIEAPARNQRKVLDLLLAVLRDTRIDAKALATAKRIIEREDGGHYGHLQRWLDRQDIGHPASDQLATELGLKCPERSDLDDMTLAQVQNLRDRWYAANNMTLIMVGGLDRLLPAYLERTFGELPATEPEERRDLETISQQAEQRRDLTRGFVGDSVKLHWLFIEPVLDNDHQQTLDLLSRYLDWALYDQLRLRNGLSYGPSVQRESFGDSGMLSLNADLERDDVNAAVNLMQQLFDHLRKQGLDADTFARIKDAAVARESWTTQGNSALADYYWGALNDYNNGRFADPARKLREVTLEQANDALKALLKDEGYLRIEKPLLGYDELYGLIALLLGVLLAAGLLRKRRQTPERPSGATRER
ncbi:insulinase family protein [Pseudomonas putida]|uniref:Insulinase family protein n=2 Tax=Bacteria TaxID=2 RepID=A0A7W2QL14_PSEPU|nr:MULTISPECIES: pitrilysin family protein [Pseudomonas]MBA6118164.1 insulinase family protein [Pseudomonas putida]MBI6944828.1 insulinase family protein [Pseudomonas putida]MBI6961157.1 insulinase family protein [Pseudomonas putida]MCZ9637894.1 insulinase family protein [Pseudomonas putida]MEC4878025.1 insulinase family protein [Pseudomonas sp. NC26]